MKADALSCRDNCPLRKVFPDFILPASARLAVLSTDIEEEVQSFNQGSQSPSACPVGCLYVPVNLRVKVIQWFHTSRMSCHPGQKLTLSISLDFITKLPPSEGKTVILMVVTHFSKVVNFNALPKLPTAKETADVLLNNIIRDHGLPRDIVSDWETQFTTKFWAEFCHLFGVSVSLSFGFHPQTCSCP